MESDQTSVVLNREWEDVSKARPTVRFARANYTNPRMSVQEVDLLMREAKNRNERRARERLLKKLPFTEISKQETARKDRTKTDQISMNTTAE